MIPPMSFNYIWVPRFVTSRDANLTYVDRAGYWDPAIAEQLAPYLEFAKSLAPPDASYSHNYDDAWPEGDTAFIRELIRRGLYGQPWALALLCTGFTIRNYPYMTTVNLSRTTSPHVGVSMMPKILVDYYQEHFG